MTAMAHQAFSSSSKVPTNFFRRVAGRASSKVESAVSTMRRAVAASPSKVESPKPTMNCSSTGTSGTGLGGSGEDIGVLRGWRVPIGLGPICQLAGCEADEPLEHRSGTGDAKLEDAGKRRKLPGLAVHGIVHARHLAVVGDAIGEMIQRLGGLV